MEDILLVEGDNQLNVQMAPLLVEMNYIYGTVFDHRTWNTLADVRVTVNGWVVYTDISGNYRIDVPDDRAYTLTFSKEGYKSDTGSIYVYRSPGMFEAALYSA